ncbi:MAG: S-layer homology domain-containing protein [Clostridia bacterium]|nr:S-layer homology domain-containing protein [Clostridia bacterium]
MKKVCVLFIALICMTSAAFASDNLSASIAYDEEKITINGTVSKSGEDVTVIVLNPGKSLDDIESEENAVQSFRKIQSDEKGDFTYSFKIHDSEKNAGWMKYYVKEDGAAHRTGQIYVASATEIDRIINKITKDGIGEEVSDELFLNVFNLSDFDFYTLCDKAKLAAKTDTLLAMMKREELETDRNNAEKIIKQCSLLEAYNQSLETDFLSQDGELLRKEFYKTKEYDLAQNINAEYIFNNILNENGKRKVVEALKGKSFAGFEEFQKGFAEKTILYSLTNAKSIGYSQIDVALSASNLSFLGMDKTNISNTGLQRAIATSSDFADKEALLNFIKNYKGESGSPAGGTSSGGTSSGRKPTAVFAPSSDVGTNNDASDENITKPVFNDIGGVEWAHRAIEELYKREIIEGKSESEFDPSGYVTREEFAKIIVKAFHLEYSKYDIMLEDVEMGKWYTPYVLAACEEGVIKGISETEFGIGRKLSRQDMCTIICRALKTESYAPESGFSDKEKIEEYAMDAVNYLASVNVINGFEDNSFRPDEPCTRAQAVKIIYEVLYKGAEVE